MFGPWCREFVPFRGRGIRQEGAVMLTEVHVQGYGPGGHFRGLLAARCFVSLWWVVTGRFCWRPDCC